MFDFDLELKKLKNPIKSLMEKDLIDLLKDSWEIIESMIVIGKNLLEDVLKNSSNIGNISYNDTLKEIKASFKRYDYRFFAHKIECSIDYQLSNPVSESLCGIEYINEYLKSLLIENKFCKAFHRDKIINILNGYCKDYKGTSGFAKQNGGLTGRQADRTEFLTRPLMVHQRMPYTKV